MSDYYLRLGIRSKLFHAFIFETLRFVTSNLSSLTNEIETFETCMG